MDRRSSGVTWALAPVLGVLLTFAPAVVGLRTLAQRDTDRMYGPFRALVAGALREGRLPLWNPYEALGKPLFAEGLHSVLHPISIAGAFVAPASVDFLILAYLVAAALGAFLLARTLGASQPASAGSALAFALSGYAVSMTANLVFLAGLSTLPWLVAAMVAAGHGARWGSVLTALATAASYFSGDVQTALVGLALGAALAAEGGGRRGIGRALLGAAAGTLLAGVQIAASRGLLLEAVLGGGEPADQLRWALAPARLLELVVPGLYRGPLGAVPTVESGAWIQPVFANSVYLGAPVLFAVTVVATRRAEWAMRRRAFLLLGASSLLLWLALGHHLGARQALAWVPIWSEFRYAEKLMAPLGLCLCALAALGADGFAAQRLSRSSTLALATTSALVITALVLLHAAPDAADGLAALLGDSGSFYRKTFTSGLRHLALALAAILAIDRLHGERHRLLAFVLLLGVVPAAATPFGAHLGSPDPHRDPSPTRLATESWVVRVGHPVMRAFTPSDRLDYFDDIALQQRRILLPSVNVEAAIDTAGAYTSFPSRRLTILEGSIGGVPPHLYRRFGVTHLALPLPYSLLDRETAQAATADGVRVQGDEALGFELWTVPHRPWAFFATAAMPASGPEEARDLMLALASGGHEGAVAVETVRTLPVAPGRVLRVSREAERVVIEAESGAPGLLVVQDAYWPGWRATIDGAPASILAADLLVRAVEWPAGSHRLELRYEPPEVTFGLLLTAFGALTIIALSLRARRPPAGAPSP